MNVPEILMFHTMKSIEDELENIKAILKNPENSMDTKKKFRRVRNAIKSAIYQAKQNKIKGWY